MPDGPYMTPDEDAVLRMIGRTGSPHAAAANLLERLEALEAAAAALEAQLQEDESGREEEDTDTPSSDAA